jgi:hypothetical protein
VPKFPDHGEGVVVPNSARSDCGGLPGADGIKAENFFMAKILAPYIIRARGGRFIRSIIRDCQHIIFL